MSWRLNLARATQRTKDIEIWQVLARFRSGLYRLIAVGSEGSWQWHGELKGQCRECTRGMGLQGKGPISRLDMGEVKLFLTKIKKCWVSFTAL